MEKNLDSSDSETSKDDDFIALAALSNKKNGIEIYLKDTISKYTDKELVRHIQNFKVQKSSKSCMKLKFIVPKSKTGLSGVKPPTK